MWERWSRDSKTYLWGLKIENDDRKWVLLLHYPVESVYDIKDAEKAATEASCIETKQVLTTTCLLTNTNEGVQIPFL